MQVEAKLKPGRNDAKKNEYVVSSLWIAADVTAQPYILYREPIMGNWGVTFVAPCSQQSKSKIIVNS